MKQPFRYEGTNFGIRLSRRPRWWPWGPDCTFVLWYKDGSEAIFGIEPEELPDLATVIAAAIEELKEKK